MNKNVATQTATAFASYTELAAACARGYVPSLRAGASDDLPTRRAKTVLESALTASGFRVHV